MVCCICVWGGVYVYMYVCGGVYVCKCVCGGGVYMHTYIHWASQVALEVKNWPTNAGDSRDSVSIPGSGRSPGEENGHPLQSSCLGNSTDRGAW